MKQVFIAFDQLFNTILGGYADETLSARAYRTNSIWKVIIDTIFFWQVNHCESAYFSEVNRKQYPPEYRSN